MGPSDHRRFACTACGKCCDRGPEMELGEAAALAEAFVLSLMFKAHSLPLHARSAWAREWHQAQTSSLGLSAALEEQRRWLKPVALKRIVDRTNDRQVFITASAIVEQPPAASCPALRDGLCTLYERRPLSCRTVPLHYSRAPSTLVAALDRFTATPGYRCNTQTGPDLLAGLNILDPEISANRHIARQQLLSDQPWKTALANRMEDPAVAREVGLPTLGDVLAYADQGQAAIVPVLIAWQIAMEDKIMSPAEFRAACLAQIARLQAGADLHLTRDLTDGRLNDLRVAVLKVALP